MTTDMTALDHADLAAREAEPGVLAAVLAHLTGDLRWAHDARLAEFAQARSATGDGRYAGARSFLADAAAALRDLPSAVGGQSRNVDDAVLLEIARAAFRSDLEAGDVARLRHHLWPHESWAAIEPADAARSGLRVTIIGAGMSGLGLAFNLAAAGVDYTILERRDSVGGVWFDSRYPDCGVDTQAFQYAYELAPNAGWSRYDAKRDEILQYIERTAEKAGVTANTRFGAEVSTATWDDHSETWSLEVTQDGREEVLETDVLVSAVGALNRPKIPQIPGLDEFGGPVFHTAEWDVDVSLAGKRVALIGNGSSGTQVGKAIAEVAGSLTAFQRTPHWIRPRGPAEIGTVGEGKRWLVQNVPTYLGWYRFYLNFVLGDGEHPKMIRTRTADGLVPSESNHQVRAELTEYIKARLGDRHDLIEKLTPRYAPYGKRLVIDNGWYDTLTQPHVSLVTDPIDRITESGIVTDDGAHHEVDVIILATGFHGTRYFWPLEIVGKSGQSLAEAHGGPENLRAYLGVVMPGYPNFFALQGPNSSVGHAGGVTFMSECQSRYILGCLQLMIEHRLSSIEVRQDVTDEYNADMDAVLEQMVWSEDGLDSRYHNAEGRIVMNHPWTIGRFWDLTRTASPSQFLARDDSVQD